MVSVVPILSMVPTVSVVPIMSVVPIDVDSASGTVFPNTMS